MKAWRAQLAKWPQEKLRLMHSGSAPLEMRDPERLRIARRETLIATAPAIAALAGPMVIALLAMSVLTPDGTGALAGFLGIGGAVIGFAGSFWSTKPLNARLVARQRDRDVEALEARGEAILGGEYVGISYSAERWRHSVLGDNMDHGVLRIDFDRLTFVGCDTRFELPASAAVKTEIRFFNEALIGPRPRLYVTWAEDARTQTFSVELPYVSSPRRRVEGIAELQSRIEAWRGERRPAFGAERSFLAPPSTESFQPRQLKYQRIGRLAKLLALLAAIPIWFGLTLSWIRLAHVLHIAPSPFAIVPLWVSAVAWILIAAKIESRLPKRYRYQNPQAVLPAVDLGPVRVEDEKVEGQTAIQKTSG